MGVDLGLAGISQVPLQVLPSPSFVLHLIVIGRPAAAGSAGMACHGWVQRQWGQASG